MKIALITIHYANSYGGTLQALATQEVLSQYGQVNIIDYKTIHLNKTMRLVRFGLQFRDFLRMGKDLFRLYPRYRLIKGFNNFMIENYSLTKSCMSNTCLESLEDEYDVFVCGSDQIWNPTIIDSYDLIYFLNFVKHKKKFSYASSMGSYVYSKDHESNVISALDSFTAISVREKNTADYLQKLLPNKKISTVLDPTLLLNKYEWFSLLAIKERTFGEPYLFVYTLKKDKFVRDIIKHVSNNLNLKIVVIDQDPILGYPSDLHIQDASPKQFLELIANASFVVTNSFHGTAFSVNFQVPFITIRPENGYNRIQTLLINLGMEKYFITDKSFNYEGLYEKRDFSVSEVKLDKLKENSNHYLNSAIRD